MRDNKQEISVPWSSQIQEILQAWSCLVNLACAWQPKVTVSERKVCSQPKWAIKRKWTVKNRPLSVTWPVTASNVRKIISKTKHRDEATTVIRGVKNKQRPKSVSPGLGLERRGETERGAKRGGEEILNQFGCYRNAFVICLTPNHKFLFNWHHLVTVNFWNRRF